MTVNRNSALTPPARPKPLRRGEGPALSPEEREKHFGAFVVHGPNACAKNRKEAFDEQAARLSK